MPTKKRRRVSRREFISTGVAGITALVGAPWVAGARADLAEIRGACMHDCPDTCAWTVTTENGRAIGLVADPDHPYTQGALCEKMDGYLTDVVYNPERVLHPLKRVGEKGEGRFERVSWDEALDDVAARLGASRLDRTICGATGGVGLNVTLGTDTGMLPEDLRQSRLIIMWGGNPVVTNPHIWPIVQRARAAGARLVVIDPLRSATAAEADWHLRPLPGTDTALALGMMHVIVREGLHDSDYIERYTVGFEKLQARLDDYSPERVAAITGLRRRTSSSWPRPTP